MRPLIFFSDFVRERFGRDLYRVPISLPFLCPARIAGDEHCIFCAESAALARHLRFDMKIEEQIRKGTEYVRRRYGLQTGLIAYFQNFTPTNAPADTLRKVYKKVLSLENFDMMIVATRPDCLPDDVVAMLKDFNSEIETWVEIGAQTARDETLKLLRRGHSFSHCEDSISRLDAAGIRTAAHVIIGLPGETLEDFHFTAKKLSSLPLSALKIHNLLILKDSELAKKYLADKNFVRPMDEYEYAYNLLEFLRLTPSHWPLMRIVADAPPENLLAPKWRMTKAQFIEFFKNVARETEKFDGCAPKILTGDGSFTIYNPEYRENYHSVAGAASEAKSKFIRPSGLESLLSDKKTVRILDLCFGLGYNAISALQIAEKSDSFLELFSVEKDAGTLSLCKRIFSQDSFEAAIISSLSANGAWAGKRSKILLSFGDARHLLREIRIKFDIVFLDPFSTEKNPELWTFDFIRELVRRLAPDGVILTYSSSFAVRGAMLRCGLHVGTTPAFGRRRGGTLASLNPAKIASPIEAKERDIICKTTAGLAFRDFGFEWNRDKILEFRNKLARRLRARGVPKWL